MGTAAGLVAAGYLLAACSHAGFLHAPPHAPGERPPTGDSDARTPAPAEAAADPRSGGAAAEKGGGETAAPETRCIDDLGAALVCFAPVILQELGPGAAARLDWPGPLDPDGSGLLADDLASLPWPQGGTPNVPLYAAAREDSLRLYLFYTLYYPADWSGDPRRPRIDHPGDLEGALVIVSRAEGRPEAVVTQAHKILYLWVVRRSDGVAPSGDPPPDEPGDLPPGASGTLDLAEGARPVLFAESGGHGLYAYGSGRWRPRGGRTYPRGPAGVPQERLLRIAPGPARDWIGLRAEAAIRPLDELRRFARPRGGGLDGLPRGAAPPWEWADRRRGEVGMPGAILLDPARLYEALRRARRP